MVVGLTSGWRSFLETCWRDMSFAARRLWKNPGFTVVAVLTLALGIGAHSAIFSVVNSVLLQPLPYKDPGKLVFVWSTMISQGVPISGLAAPDFREFRDRNRVFSGMAAYTYAASTYTVAGVLPKGMPFFDDLPRVDLWVPLS